MLFVPPIAMVLVAMVFVAMVLVAMMLIAVMLIAVILIAVMLVAVMLVATVLVVIPMFPVVTVFVFRVVVAAPLSRIQRVHICNFGFIHLRTDSVIRNCRNGSRVRRTDDCEQEEKSSDASHVCFRDDLAPKDLCLSRNRRALNSNLV